MLVDKCISILVMKKGSAINSSWGKRRAKESEGELTAISILKDEYECLAKEWNKTDLLGTPQVISVSRAG